MTRDESKLGTAQELQKRLTACLNTQEVRGVINDFCTAFGGVVNVNLLCGKQYPGKTMCVVDFMRDNAQISLCASILGGHVFGFNSIVFHFPTHPDFGCVQGFPSSASCSCTARN